jgi:hypothetical protein
MSSRIDDVDNLNVIIMRGDPDDWLVGLGTSAGDGEEFNVGSQELKDMPTNKSLIETEILLTAWLAGRGFVHASPWRTHADNGSETRATDVRADFVRK